VTDERPESLAAQAASWVPPWERQQRPPDRDYQAAATDGDISDDLPEDIDAAHPDDDEDWSAAGLSDDDDDFDEAFEGPNPPGYGEVPDELPPVPGESGGPATVDAPAERPGEPGSEPTDVGSEPQLPLPGAIEAAVEQAEDDELGMAVDAPLPPDGDDAGDVFDAAADDDLSDDSDLDLPFAERVPPADDDEAPADDDDAPADDEAPADEAAGDDDEPAGDYDATAGDYDEAPADDDVTAAASAGSAAEATPGEPGQADTGAADHRRGAAAEAFAAGRADAEAALGPGGNATGRAQPRVAVPAQGRGTGPAGAAVGAEVRRTQEELDLGFSEDDAPAPMDDAELRAALEAILLVVDEPVAEMQLAQITEQPTERVAAMLEDISARYTAAGHGFDLRRAAGGWRLYTRPEYAAYVERFVLDGQSVRLTQAALETLAVVAYKQPVTRSRISAIRGVNCDGVMRTLVTRGLIEECGTEGETGAYLYRTTPLFLEKLGLNSVDQLPPLAPFLPDDVEEVLDASG
jgi:segregation and condensation protein B